MNKAELVAKMAKDAKLSKGAADKALTSFIDGVSKSLKKGQKGQEKLRERRLRKSERRWVFLS